MPDLKINSEPSASLSIETNGIYLTNHTYQQNVEKGPTIQADWQKELKKVIHYQSPIIDFLGYKINNPLGVPAGPLLSASWVKLASDLNFSIITYKTIRGHFHPCHPIPNVVSVDDRFIHPNDSNSSITTKPCSNLEKLTITNSFGMPSQEPKYLEKDIPDAKKSLKKGQILVVSVVASDMNQAVDDFFKVAHFASKLGADAIEVNLSCPNVKDASSMLYMNEELSHQICKKITQSIHIPLIIKIGYIPDENLLEKVLKMAHNAGVSAVSGINSYAMKVYQEDKKTAALDANRLSGGICGYAIEPIGLDFTKKGRKLIEKNKLNLALIGMGGIMKAKDFNDYLQSGADVAMSATGMMWFPFIAKEYAKKYQKNLLINQ